MFSNSVVKSTCIICWIVLMYGLEIILATALVILDIYLHFLPYLIFGWLNVIHMFLICEWSNGRNVFFSCFNGRTQIGRYRYMGLNQGYRIMG